MEDYREAQRQKWLQKQQAAAVTQGGDGGNATNDIEAAGSSANSSASAPSNRVPTSQAASSVSNNINTNTNNTSTNPNNNTSGAPVAPSSAADTGAPRELQLIKRLHILPVGPQTGDVVEGPRRLQLLAPELRRKRNQKECVRTGHFMKSSNIDFVVVKADPEEGILGHETDYFVDGSPILRFEKVQFICLWDFESRNNGQDSTSLFKNYIRPYFQSITDSGEDRGSVVTVGDTLKIFDREFQVLAAEPAPPDIGIIDSNTMVYVEWDETPEFEKIHIVPFQDTLPHAYEFDVFQDYLKPYLTRNKHMRFGVNDQFAYQGVQFKVVCCEPNGPARIGHNTRIYCEGVLHPSLRNLLPPELLEQLSHLPPGLQMLLLNTEALAGAYEERLMEVQEMLSRRRGLSTDVINQVDKFRWGDRSEDLSSQTQCMVCLSDFVQGEEVRNLPCNHVFHASCIDEWLRRCTDCPICKQNVDRTVRT
eukprot:TRINITY_DN49067_c0_g1_i1.p1 TRINITY_DN49067_c0_g1~~TRINITY_DN49067_c0_g1_i1.p1  ORF type:complete len:478 (-),score=85.76 TRINITY_DN49067_c0_g1_i1:116-1549(-)